MILVFNDIRRAAKWLWTGEKPTAESVERVVIDKDKDHMFENGPEFAQDTSKKEIIV
jgi:hypothetical protein